MKEDTQSVLLSAAEQLFQSGSVGFVVLDNEYRIRVSGGKSFKWIKPNTLAFDSMPFLVGYEDMLSQVANGNIASFKLPYISLNGITDFDSATMSVEIYRGGIDGAVGLLIRDESDQHDLERELLQNRNELAMARQEEQRLTDIIRVYEHEIDRRLFEGFIGSSLRMQAVYRIIESAATSDATVFITGESGTGKELCAEAIHRLSHRKDGPFIPVNCAAIPRELIESELFGHVKGAFTGAVANRTGAVMQANGGTLFLDEIGEMDVKIQSKLLRFVQSRKIQRVGKSQLEEVDVRIVCATNRDALTEVKAGRFREDLYYRLHVIPIELPPLRERAGDVIQLAEAFLEQMSEREGKRFSKLSSEVMQRFLDYEWPGNVRELQNVVQQIVVLNNADEVSLDMVPLPVRTLSTAPAPTAPLRFNGPRIAPSSQGTAKLDADIIPLAQIERQTIEGAIEQCSGNIRLAAARLKIAPATIYRRLAMWKEDSSSPS